MIVNWPEATETFRDQLKSLRKASADTMKAFSECAEAALHPGALDTKTKELMALAIGVAVRCDDCIAFHAKAAVQHGATREEIREALALAIYMGAGPSVMYASHALRAFDQFSASKSES